MKLRISLFVAIFSFIAVGQIPGFKMVQENFFYNGKDGKKDTILTVNFTYPVFSESGEYAGTAAKLNSYIRSAVFGGAGDGVSIFNSLKETAAEMEDSVYFMGPWAYEVQLNPEFQEGNVASFRYIQYEYLGGAHPNSLEGGINLNLATGDEISEEEIFIPTAKNELNKMGEAMVRADRQIAPETSLSDYGYWFEDNKFVLNTNFIITGDGIEYIFNPYEVGPYVLGVTPVLFKWSDIVTLIKPESVVTGILK